jgi:hydrogenase expression/formation protein HypC
MIFTMPGKILEEYTVRNNRLGLVQFGNTCRPIFLDLVPDAHIGDYVRVHVGFAIEQVEKSEAEQAYAKLAENGKWKTADVGLEAALEADEALPEAARRVKPS